MTIEPGKRGGKPRVRGLRITVYDVLEYLASGMSHADILRELPYDVRVRHTPTLCEKASPGQLEMHSRRVSVDS
ncbi:MAG: DUF433 domain-containing protein [Candidatus Acidiferrales bacterium]